MMTPEQKKWIDAQDYESLLRKWRFAPVGDPIVQGEAGAYFRERMLKLRAEIGPEAGVAASKRVGWEQP